MIPTEREKRCKFYFNCNLYNVKCDKCHKPNLYNGLNEQCALYLWKMKDVVEKPDKKRLADPYLT